MLTNITKKIFGIKAKPVTAMENTDFNQKSRELL